MKRIWKYVRRVEKHLPLSKRIPVGGAIYATLRDQARARAKELGRELSDEEIDEIAQAYGDPRQVAERHVACDPGRRPLVERYLAAVGRHLPQDKAHDILAEMREAIDSRIDAREEEAGGGLDDEAIAAELKAFGPPMVAAGRFAARDRLVGPDLYPFFWPSAKALVGVVAAAAILLAAIAALAAGEWIRFVPRAMGLFMDLALPAFAIMMIVFIVLDRSDAGKKIAERWSPRSLPEAHIAKPKPLFDSVLGLGFDVLFILWWTNVVDFPRWAGVTDATIQLNWAGVWDQFHGVILVLACLSAAAHLYDILHPGWSRLRSAASIGGHVVGAYVFSRLAMSSPLVVEGPGATEFPEEAARLLNSVNTGLQAVLWLIAVLTVGAIIAESWRMIRSFAESMPRMAENS